MARWVAFIWLVLGMITATQVVIGMTAARIPMRPWVLFESTMSGWLVLALAAPGILWLGRRFPVGRGHWLNLAIHTLVALALSFAHSAWTAELNWVLKPLRFSADSYRSEFIAALYSRFQTGVIVYAATILIGSTIHSVRRVAQREADSARLEGELLKAQLGALLRQLEPHFLFNTLNGITGLVRESRNEEAVGMIRGLNDLLRRVLNDSGRQFVPLSEEVEFLESYVGIQSMRFGDRLKVTLSIPPNLRDAQVPPLILQPLVENAIVHGIAKRVEGGNISVAASELGGVLSMSVANDGPPLTGGDSGVGTSNTRARLAKLYGGDFTFELRNRDSFVEAALSIPYRAAS